MRIQFILGARIRKESREIREKILGLKGYLTNTVLSKDEIIENYNHLWKIEGAFRISKTDSCKVYKELERQLKEKRAVLSPGKAIDIAKTIYSIKPVTPLNKGPMEQTLILNEEQMFLAQLFQF